jgi:sugar phosphate permease
MPITYDRARFLRLRWSIYAILALSYVLVFFHRMAPAVVSAELMSAFQTTGAALGSLAAMYYYIYTAMQIPSGVLADTLGARGAVTVGNLVAGLGAILFGLATTFAVAATGRILVGLGVSVVFVGLMKSNTLWFSERDYGFISGLTLTLGNLGAILAAAPLAAVLTLFSWRAVFIGLGVLAILLAVACLLVVRNRPEDAGFPSMREMEGKASYAARTWHWWPALKQVLGNRRVWPGVWVNLGMSGGMLAFMGLWAVPLLRDVHGLERSAAANYTTVGLLAFATGTLVDGWLSDRLGRRKPLVVISTWLYLLACLLFAFAPWQPGPLGFALFALMGFSTGGFIIMYASARELVEPAVAGMALALVNTGAFLGAALIQPLFGWVMDLHWDGRVVNGVRVYAPGDYHAGLLLLLGCAVLAVIASSRLRETYGRNVAVGD